MSDARIYKGRLVGILERTGVGPWLTFTESAAMSVPRRETDRSSASSRGQPLTQMGPVQIDGD